MNKGAAILLILLLCSCYSCMSEEEKEKQVQDRARSKMEDVDMTSIDRYPLFDNCDEMIANSNCFYKELHAVINQRLRNGKIPIQLEEKDSLYASITVKKNGHIVYDSIFKCATVIKKEQANLFLQQRLVDLPVIKSAVKRSIPVATTYRLPIIFTPIDSLKY